MTSTVDLERMQRALMICHTFPPSAAVASFRATRFARYLPDFGWQPVVLAMSPGSYLSGRLDQNLADALPKDLVIERVPAWRPFRFAKRTIKSALQHCMCSKESSTLAEGQVACNSPLNAADASISVKFKRLVNRTENFLLATPDSEIAWLLPAFSAACKLIRCHKPNLVYCTGPPHSANLLACLVSSFAGLPLILDFRDPWSRTQWEASAVEGLAGRLNRWLERRCVKSAALVILNTPQLRDDFENHYPSAWSNKFVFLSNGFEPELVPQARELLDRHAPKHANGTFRLCHTGTVYGERDLRPLISLAASMSSPYQRIQIEQIGEVDHCDQLKRWVSEQHLDPHISFLGRVPHAEVLRRMAAAHAFLILQPGTGIQIPGKLFEMIPFNKPILALTGRGATQDVMKRYELGAHAEPGNNEGLARALEQVRDRSLSGTSGRLHQQALADFDGKSLTGQLAAMFDAVGSHA